MNLNGFIPAAREPTSIEELNRLFAAFDDEHKPFASFDDPALEARRNVVAEG